MTIKYNTVTRQRGALSMKHSRSDVRSKVNSLPVVKFEEHAQTLTSFSGLVLIQKLFACLSLKQLLRECFRSKANGTKVFDRAIVFLQLIVHFLLGYRELSHCRYYQDDPLVQRVLGLKVLPDVATISRMLKDVSLKSVDRLRQLMRTLVLDRLKAVALLRVTLDFDGSVLSTSRYAEGVAVGFNKKKKGARSYYPLFCTVAQTGQVFDFLHRPGNVHDSKQARQFILDCVARVQAELPGVVIEVRMDSAFFSDEIVMALQSDNIEFSISVPFERFVELKAMIEDCTQWAALNYESSCVDLQWRPKSWNRTFRFVFVRHLRKKQLKGELQLDLFVPVDWKYEYQVIVTNKTINAWHLVEYHHGRGSQEGIFGELKSHCHIGYVPVRTRLGNQVYLLAGLFAHNLIRELQMRTGSPARRTTANRATLWIFETVDTFRKSVLQRAGRLTRPGGVLTLTIGVRDSLKTKICQTLVALDVAA